MFKERSSLRLLMGLSGSAQGSWDAGSICAYVFLMIHSVSRQSMKPLSWLPACPFYSVFPLTKRTGMYWVQVRIKQQQQQQNLHKKIGLGKAGSCETVTAQVPVSSRAGTVSWDLDLGLLYSSKVEGISQAHL